MRVVSIIIPVIHLAEVRPHDTMRLIEEVPGPWVFAAGTAQSIPAEVTQAVAGPGESHDWAWATPERVRELRAKRQARALPQYGPLYDAVLDTIYHYDPWFVGWKGDVPFGAEEYTPEADRIVPRLAEAQSVGDVRRIVHEEMRHYYGKTTGGEERFTEIAEEIWQAMSTQRDITLD